MDVAPYVFERLGISYDDLSFFSEIDADGIRLDEGFDGHKEALMTYNPNHLNQIPTMSSHVITFIHNAIRD